MSQSTTRTILCFWIALLALASLAVSTPVPEPEPVPIDSNLAQVISGNLNLGCQHGCAAAASVQQMSKNAALGVVASPLSFLGGFVLAGSVLAAI